MASSSNQDYFFAADYDQDEHDPPTRQQQQQRQRQQQQRQQHPHNAVPPITSHAAAAGAAAPAAVAAAAATGSALDGVTPPGTSWTGRLGSLAGSWLSGFSMVGRHRDSFDAAAAGRAEEYGEAAGGGAVGREGVGGHWHAAAAAGHIPTGEAAATSAAAVAAAAAAAGDIVAAAAAGGGRRGSRGNLEASSPGVAGWYGWATSPGSSVMGTSEGAMRGGGGPGPGRRRSRPYTAAAAGSLMYSAAGADESYGRIASGDDEIGVDEGGFPASREGSMREGSMREGSSRIRRRGHPSANRLEPPGSLVRSTPHWPQSYRQSMDLYSYMPSPSIPKIFSPLHDDRLPHHHPHYQHDEHHPQYPVSPTSVPQHTVAVLPTPSAVKGLLPQQLSASLPGAKQQQAIWQSHTDARVQEQQHQQKQESDLLLQQQLQQQHQQGLPGVAEAGLTAPLLPPQQKEKETAEAAAAAAEVDGELAKWKVEDGLPVGDEGEEDKEEDEEEEYVDAYFYPEEGSSFVQAMLNGVNILTGVGVLTTPYALMQGGWSAILLLLLLAAVCCYTGLLLRWSLDSEPGLETYPDIGEAAYGPLGRFLISIVLYVELYACCVEFLILEGDNLGAMFPNASVDVPWLGLHVSAHDLFVLLSALCILPTMYLRDLSLLAYVSAGGVVASLVVISSVAWLGFTVVGFNPPPGPILNLVGMPVSIGLFGFCFSGHAVFPNIYTSMRTPADYNKVLYFSFALCVLLYGGMAVMGFSMFGSDLQSQITLNLPQHHLASSIAVWTTVVNPFTKYAISMTPVALCLEELLPLNPSSPEYRRASLAIRTALVVSTTGVALLVPFFGYVMAFIGSFLSMTVSVMLPCACYLSLLGKKVPLSQRLLCYMLIAIGAVCAVAGTYSAVKGIISSTGQ